jgi:hypothetical protein
LKAEYHFSGLVPFAPTQDAIHLGLLKVGRIPPHLVLTVGEKYFSLEKEKCVVNGDLGLLAAKLNRNGTECLFVPLPRIAKGDAIQWANGAYLKFPAAHNGFTCLDPVKLFTAKAYGWQTEAATVVFDLLDMLEEGTLLRSAHIHLHKGQLTLHRYNREDVLRHIALLDGR